MTVEIRDDWLKIKMTKQEKYERMITQDIGSIGKLYRTVGLLKNGKWETQTWKFRMKDFEGFYDIEELILDMQNESKIKNDQAHKAISLSREWWKKHATNS